MCNAIQAAFETTLPEEYFRAVCDTEAEAKARFAIHAAQTAMSTTTPD